MKMAEDLRHIKLIKQLLVVFSIVVIALTGYNARYGFWKGWNDVDNVEISKSEFHIPIFESVIKKQRDSIVVAGRDGYLFKLQTDYLVKGDILNKSKSDRSVLLYDRGRNALMLGIIFMGLMIFGKLYYFLKDSSNGEIFTIINIERVKSIGLYCISLSIILFIWDLLSFKIKAKLFQYTEYTVEYSFDFNYLLFSVGLVTMVIMYVFKKGYQLKQEQDLTI